MAEAGEVGHWKVLLQMGNHAADQGIIALAEWQVLAEWSCNGHIEHLTTTRHEKVPTCRSEPTAPRWALLSSTTAR